MSEIPRRSETEAAWKRLCDATTELAFAACAWDRARQDYIDAQDGKMVAPMTDDEKAAVWDEAMEAAMKELGEAHYYDHNSRKKNFANFWRAADWIKRHVPNPYRGQPDA